MSRRLSPCLGFFLFMAMLVATPAMVIAETGVQGNFWCGPGEDEGFAVVDGIAYPDELQGGERVKVLLMPEGADREKVLEVLAKRELMFRAGLDNWVTFDFCRDEDGSDSEVCGIHFSCGSTSLSRSGFGVYGHFTHFLEFGDERVEAVLGTDEDEGSGTDTAYGFDIGIKLPITRFASE